MINLDDPGAPSNGHLVPQREVIKRFLTLATRKWETLEVPVELEIRLLKERQCRHRRFGVDEIDAATEWAAEQNEFGWNAHYVVNPIYASHVGAARADAIVASRYVFIDTDTPEALARIETSALAPSIEVTTGTLPHRRVHQYFEITEGMIGIVDWASLMTAAIRHFKSDPAAKDPSRAMRLPGTITWPTEKKRKRGYVPELTTVSVTDAAYSAADLRDAFGHVPEDTAPRQALPALRGALPDVDFATLASALLAIPNNLEEWDGWNRIAMAWWSETGGSEEAFTVFDEWSARHSSYDPVETRKRWDAISGSPPSRLTGGTIIYLARQNGWRGAAQRAAKPPHPNGNDEAAAGQREDAGGRGPKQADMLIALADQAMLFHTPDGTGFADLKVNGHRETWPIRRKDFQRWLVRRFFRETGGAPNSEALQSALNLIEAKAQFDGSECDVFIRVGQHGGKLYLDLCDDKWRAVEIETDGWRIVAEPPVRFRRAAGMKPLPEPQRGGSIDQLRSSLNIASNDDFVLAVAWVLAALRNRGPYPVLALAGEQGVGKSLLVAMLRSLLDPNTAPLRSLPREERDLFIAATNGHALAFDNVSGLPAWLSDALCRVATGAAFAVRQNYTDADEMLFAACRPIVLNGIEDIVSRSDLADRTLFLTLPPIAEEARRTEGELWAAFETKRPLILGALLDAVAKGLKRLPETRLERLPRMADFALWATACETALWSKGTFMKAYAENIGGAVDAVIDADPVADAIRTVMTAKREQEGVEQPEWEGTASALLTLLTEQAGERIAKSKSWPESGRALAGRMRRAATGLRKIGVEIGFGRKAQARIISIKGAPNSPEPEGEGNLASSPSLPSSALSKSKPANDLAAADLMTQTPGDDANTVSPAVCVITNPLKNGRNDGDDANDANPPAPSSPRVERRI